MKRQRSVIGIISIFLFSIALIGALVFGGLTLFIYKDINFEADERLFESSRTYESTIFYADDSEGEGYTPVQIELGGSLRKIHYSIDDISPYLKDGFIAVEDKIFYSHKGVDIKRTLLAALNQITKRKKIFGASTITQQVVKNISGDNQINLKRKIGEIIRAIHIERNYEKDEIFEVYLNVIPMSDNIFGVGAASKAYFGKEPEQLLPEEAATLIGITNAPSAYSPYTNPEACKKKRDIVLSVMYNEGVIDDEEYNRAINTELKIIPRESREDRIDSWFVETAIEDIVKDLTLKYDISTSAARMMLLGGGHKVYTTMNRRVQESLENYFENVDNLPDEVAKGLNYAMVVTDSVSGDLVGIVGRAGKKTGNRLLNYALIPHTPASTLKPIAIYAKLIDQGKINWATVFDDTPVSFYDSGNEIIEYPHNSPNVYDGLTTVKDAIRLSKNTIAVRLCNMITPSSIYYSLKNDYKFDTLIEKEGNTTDIAVSPMALGQLTKGVSLLKLTEAYSVFPSEGVHAETRSYISVYDYNNRLILEKKQSRNRLYKESTAKIINQLLMEVVESGTASSISLNHKVDLAGKTGTSGNNKDKLFVGYTPYYTAGIWCGYDNGTTIGNLNKSHLKIWDEVMTEIHSDKVISDQRHFSTDGLIKMPYCKDSGELYSNNCIHDPRGNRREFGYFTADNMPSKECNRHVMCLYDSETKAIALDGCPRENLISISLISVSDRAFPKEIYISDAEYVYRDFNRYDQVPIDYSLPYFYNSIPQGIYVGRSKGKKQFNSGCYIHSD